jgi:uncharacterized surface protein with fasciclin (FAS1) repeats
MRKHLAVLLAAAVAGSMATAALASSSSSQATSASIVGVAAGNKNFSTLVSLVKKAGLVNTLDQGGPFTVFAPTNAAFASLAKNDPALYKQVTSSKKLLQTILTYHVVADRIPATAAVSAAKKKMSIATVQGEEAALSFKNGRIVINNGARVVIPDVKASNGVVHAINRVIVPPSVAKEASVAGIAAGSKSFTTLVSLLKQAGLVDTLAEGGPFTVFAPTNAAFAQLKAAAPDTFKAVTTDPDLLAKVLTYHVVAGDIKSMKAIAVAKKNGSVQTLAKEPIKLSLVDGKLTLNGTSTVATADLDAINGVVHVIDAVIVPPSLTS